MKLKLTLPFALTFLALTFVMHEAHEIVHTTIGRLICGCWGNRDFNVWSLCGNCSEQIPYSVLSTFAGPIFTYLMIWLGTYLMNNPKDPQKVLGFSLVFANIPFTRIFGSVTGGGDEVWGLNLMLHNHNVAWLLGTIIILSVVIYPLYKCFKLIGNESPVVWFLVFLLIPGQIDTWVILIILNSLLQKGLLSNYWILGSPVLVTVWTASITLTYILTRKNIYKLADNNNIDY
ncbi:hypothetical protein [Pedobacter sp. R-06]|uniref:hypothetical protein n=1 Tax=Pedobacter sp. R-06 TaxID=3404051 RepID=UPI003CEAAE7B